MSVQTLKNLRKDIKTLSNPAKAKILQRFFKTGPGQYGEGDIFYGIVVPLQRKLVKKYWQDLSLSDLDKLLRSKIHEERLVALLVLVKQFSVATPSRQSLIYKFYLAHSHDINNWDLVDLSAPNIVGEYLINKSRKPLYQLAKSKNLWQRRVAILATFAFIKKGQADDTLALAKLFLADRHDLMHKATGWMLREVGKRCNEKTLTDFLDAYATQMPRTALRYAIERLPEKKRKHYLCL